jgi:hypothetical protein
LEEDTSFTSPLEIHVHVAPQLQLLFISQNGLSKVSHLFEAREDMPFILQSLEDEMHSILMTLLKHPLFVLIPWTIFTFM